MVGQRDKGTKDNAYVVFQFYLWFNFDFLLFFPMLIYDNEYQTKVIGIQLYSLEQAENIKDLQMLRNGRHCASCQLLLFYTMSPRNDR